MICKKCKTPKAPHMNKCFACGYTKFTEKHDKEKQSERDRNNEAFYQEYQGESHE